ncbi:hypothetical protein ACQCT3_18030 [Sutcliffiella horikoshii]|uniref:hypothetical protein n=1 Tax=Sutcliffiella horikoshii TaxID=79883 RepID=UPI003CE712EC
MARAIKNLIVSFFTVFFTKWLEDFLIFAGLSTVVINTYLLTTIDINILIGNYLVGAILILAGIAIARK